MQESAATPLYITLESNIQKFDLPDIDWRTMIQDHKENIKINGELIHLSAELVQEYQYRPEEFLYEHLRKSKGLTWIMLFINDLNSKMEFNTSLTQIYIPNDDHIGDLYRTYHSIKAARKKNI